MATEKRMIDANEAVPFLENSLSTIKQMDTNGNMQKYIKMYEEFIDFIKNCPTVDAVEVVRCKDCVNGIYDDVNCIYKCVKSAECDPEYGDWIGFVSYHNADYYCADGERKDNE